MTPTLTIPEVRLRVPDLVRSRRFYVEQIGFVVAGDRSGRLELATSAATERGTPREPARLTLIEDRTAPAAPSGAAGLFHAAVLLRDRAALGAWLQAAADRQVAFSGFSDHGVSEAIYLNDPDGNGLEFYVDRPPAAWPRHHGELAMVTEPLDVSSLLASASGPSDGDADAPLAGATWGHLHFRVCDLKRSEAFYQATLGLATTQRFGTQARFLSVDGYHHHLGLNTWELPNQPRPPRALGLAGATVALAGRSTPQVVNDPDGIELELIPLPRGSGAPAPVTGSP